MVTKKATKRERGLESSREGARKNMLVIMSAVIVVAAVLFLAPSCTTPANPANHQPIITSLAAEQEEVFPLESCQITCNATDPDGDELNYVWVASGGSITGTDAAVNWIAPEEIGMYDITVVVDDGRGGNATRTIRLTAANSPPPVIEGLNVTAKEPKYLKETATGYKVGKTKEYDIECIASGTGTLSYNWTCTGGEISGEASLITWTAPNTEGDVTVTVKVFDDAGNWVDRTIVFEVVPCSACIFG